MKLNRQHRLLFFFATLISIAAIFAPMAWLGVPLRADNRGPFQLPRDRAGRMPPTLSATGVFADLKTLSPQARFVAYDVNVAFWSDGAAKRRWIALPENKTIHFSAVEPWRFPAGTTFIKHFEFPTDATGRLQPRRIETRILICAPDGDIFGATYRWRPDSTDADLVSACDDQDVVCAAPIVSSDIQIWHYPSPTHCAACHTPAAGGILGINTRQLNRTSPINGENQLIVWQRLGMFDQTPENLKPDSLARLAPIDDLTATLENRARSYLDVNCAQCHQPAGTAVADFDARFATPLAQTGLIDVAPRIDLGLDHARFIAPHDPWRSVILARMATLEGTRMPPLSSNKIDQHGVELLTAWIRSLPGADVLPPPTFQADQQRGHVTIVIHHPDASAAIHYTTDGSAPTLRSPRYTEPLRFSTPLTFRARAFKPGATRSILIQQTFVDSH